MSYFLHFESTDRQIVRYSLSFGLGALHCSLIFSLLMRLIATRYLIKVAVVIEVVVVAIGSFTNRDYHSAIKSPSIRLITFGLEIVTH